MRKLNDLARIGGRVARSWGHRRPLLCEHRNAVGVGVYLPASWNFVWLIGSVLSDCVNQVKLYRSWEKL